ncbi:MAG TPA: hypothetical protein IAA23_05025 [Candidatus Helicobacter avistercoris]|nr:hypothetical protein [Candidatus Helicobacter avistercoris]
MGLNANEICYGLENAYVVAQNEKNTFLGKIGSSFSSDSIFNEFGNFGSEYSSLSIFNEYGDFGSEFSSYSATNPITLTPPMIIKEGKLVGYISTNKTIPNSISPSLLKVLCKEYF